MSTCYTINRNKNYFRIRYLKDGATMVEDYPLDLVQELKTQNDQTYQQVADILSRPIMLEHGHA